MADEIWTTLRVLQWTQKRFAERGIKSARLDAEVLLAQVLRCDRVRLYTAHDQPLQKAELAAYRALITRRLDGEPVAYLIGRKEFWSLPLSVDERVLVPRPETETLVEAVLEHLKGRSAPRVVDVGTGSGAIAIAVAHDRPDAEVLAIDRSPRALEVARANVAALEVEVELLDGDLLAPVSRRGPFHVIASNPPYIPEGDFEGLPREVKREPREALLSGSDGLRAITALIAQAPPLLTPDGLLAIEVGAGQAPAVMELMRAAGLGLLQRKKDLAGIERVVLGRREAAR